jgi:hypothetical protein
VVVKGRLTLGTCRYRVEYTAFGGARTESEGLYISRAPTPGTCWGSPVFSKV